MIKHRLMLSAAAAALLTAALAVAAARADTEVSSASSTPLLTSTSGNIVIDATGSVSIATAGTAAVTLNSNNVVTNSGTISNANTDNGIGLVIDTTAGNIVAGTGISSTGSIDVGGSGTSKRGIVIQGGNTFYGPITLTDLIATSTLTGTSTTAQSSAVIVQGDGSAAFLLTQGTKVTSNILLGGGGILQNASVNSTASNSIIVDLDGTLNGDLFLQGGLSGVGPGLIGLQTLGGIHSCASDTAAPSGFTCPSSSGGSLVNAATISLIGSGSFNTRGNNPEAASAVVIGGSIDGGFLNTGPGTSINAAAAVISSSGLTLSGVSNPTVLIDPTRSITGTLTAPRGPVIIGPVTADIDSIDPGYSVINRGTIRAQPTDPELGTAAMVIQGASATYITCLSSATPSPSGQSTSCSTAPQARTDSVTSTVNGATTTRQVNYTALGGLLNTGSITAQASTNSQTVTSSGITSATGLYVGPFATIPIIDVRSEAINGSSNTPGTIIAQVSGIGQGSAFGIILAKNANVPLINVGQNASIIASVSTNTFAPTAAIATASSPFSLVSEAILDQGGSLRTINNAGVIQANNTTLIPDTGAVASSITDAIDLQAGTTGVTINNSGRILGNILMNASGNGSTLNVGNTGTSGTANATGVINTPSNYAIVAEAITSQSAGFAPTTTPALIDFGSGNGHFLHVGGFGYVNGVINSGAGALAVQVDSNGQLFVANTTSTVQASTLNVAANGTLGLAISQTNLNSLNPVVQAN
ncbi:MAG TPA: hypothetical protein VNX61_04100, partial [Rhizomicrobium sp.]|nr:hypothetical protein [Rhizomicrobium sp.]